MTPKVPVTRVIPIAAWITAAGLYLLAFLALVISFSGHHLRPPAVLAMVVIPLVIAGYTLMVGYVYGDARRRGMRYVMWTLLAIFLTNGIGVILYFILRDPLMVYCSRCGSGVNPNHAYCPRCGGAVQPSCPQCHRTIQPAWSHCAWCGSALGNPALRGPDAPLTA
ncbi:MAG: zinc ribbon domain-containing protein [Candidatus Solibacter sp.]